MKRLGWVLLLGILSFVVYWFVFRKSEAQPAEAKANPIRLQKHSPKFQLQTENLVNRYLEVKNALVESDTAHANTSMRDFIQSLDSLQLDELKNDTAGIYETARMTVQDLRANAVSFLQQTDLREKRKDFKSLTEMMYPAFFKTVNYEGQTLFIQYCPMAFDEGQGATWISLERTIMNPYLGKDHPEYKATMLHCGEIRDSVYLP